jgi:hypothetical protein
MSLSTFLYTSSRGKQIQVDTWSYTITQAVTVSANPIDDASSLVTFAALTQASIDAFLGTSSEFTAAQFDATSMGADAMGVLIDLKGQADSLESMVVKCYSGTAGATLVERSVDSIATLQDSTLATECALGANGNLGLKIDWGNTPDFDALTSGRIDVTLRWRAK